MPKKLTKAVGFLLIPSNGPIKGRPRAFASDTPDRVEVSSVPVAKPAHEVFSADEMERRLAHYAARAAAGLPLFGDGPVEPAPAVPTARKRNGKPATVAPNRVSLCCCCGEAIATMKLAAAGWHSRPVIGEDGGEGETESYCPVCFDRFGWGDGE